MIEMIPILMQPLITFVFFTFILSSSNAQVIKLYETEHGKEDREVVAPGIIDINSAVKLKLSQDSLALKLARLGDTTALNDLVRRIDQLNILLENQKDILEIIQNERNTKSNNQDKINILGDYSRFMLSFYDNLKKLPEVTQEVNRLFEEYFERRSSLDRKQYPSPQSYVIQNLGNQAQELQRELRTSSMLKQYKIVLLTFLNTRQERRRVHVENFDRYSLGEFFQVEQFVTTFSEEQIDKFRRTQELAQGLNKLVNQDFDDFKKLVYANFPSIPCFQELLQNADKYHRQIDTLFTANRDLAESYLDQSRNLVTAIISDLTYLQDFNTTGASITILDVFNQRQEKLIKKAKDLPDQFAKLWSRLPDDLKQTNEPLSKINDQVNQCLGSLKTDMKTVEHLSDWVRRLVKPFKQTAVAADEIGEEVIRYTLGSVPEEGYVDLRYTGKRENRDELEIKLKVEMPSPGDDKMVRTLEIHRLTLQQIKLYSVTKINLILAHPYGNSDKVALDKDFQFAPSGSVLFKSGSRKSNFYNNFLDPGLGFNVSAPDFDLDGTPDFATGVILTIVRDIISFGWNYNTRTDSPFIFFGVSLPFNMPGLPINTVQVENLE